MILIFSTPTDNDTNLVMDWLRHLNEPVVRINDEELMEGKTHFFYDENIPLNSYFICYENKIYLSQIRVVWFRKFGFLKNYQSIIGDNNDLMTYVRSEFNALRTLLCKLLKNKKWLFDINKLSSKIEILQKAKLHCLQTPKTIVTTQKEKLTEFFLQNNQSIITKSIAEAKYVNFRENAYMFHTHLIENLDCFENEFSPSLFQQYVEKDIELRVFFLNDKCYSMAIFSQNNEKTKVDFRNYDRNLPNRFVPFKLPHSIEQKIIAFMKDINLNTGSLDIIKSKHNGEYYFLEVNPSGQFGMVSIPCNYNLHKKTAYFLIELNNEN